MPRIRIRRTSPWLCFALSAGVALAACTSKRATVSLGTRAEGSYYRHPEYPYEVRSFAASPVVMLSPEWKSESLRVVSGTFDEPQTQGSTVEQHYDWNQDGQADASESLDKYELRLVHDSGAVVFIRAVPVPKSLEDDSLGELAHAYLQAVTREGDMAARFSPADLPTPTDAKFEVGVLDEASCRVSGVEAYRLEVVSQRTAPQPGDKRRARLVIVHPGYRHLVASDPDAHEVKVMLVAAYTNTPEDFDRLEGDFSRFLGQWVLGGYGEAIPTERLGHTCQP